MSGHEKERDTVEPTETDVIKSEEDPFRVLKDAVPLRRFPDLVMVLDTPKGRGVFASAPIWRRTTIDVSPVLILDPQENEQHISKTDVYNYTYTWPLPSPSHNTSTHSQRQTPAQTQTQALPLGLGFLLNHHHDPNTGWTRDVARQTITYTTLRDVGVGEELCISYGDEGALKGWRGWRDVDGRSAENDGEERAEEGADLTRIDVGGLLRS